MSTTIDERVVEMRFDNQHFENNVSTTMSTLAKLKQSLNLTGASKGLENVSSAAKNCDMSGLSNAVESVKARFSALQVMGVTALANITNSAVNAGKRIVSALTIDPIKAGFQEYETQINAVQTILANTSHAGTDLQDVNRVLDELNEYADKTIYNFTQMTRNIGTFTAAGVDLETSASAIKGIANLAAVSGSTSQQASTAMYQLSQAIANGRVNLQDWNSVVNAGMGGKVFQDALVKTAANMAGVSEEAFRAEKITGSFRESISSKDGEGWLTSDILLKTLKQFTMAAEEGSEQWEAYKESLMEEGYTDAQATEILKMANTATDAATKVKTFTQLWDTLKESAQSGWTQSWEIIIGDFEEAKTFLTEISDTIGGMLNESAQARNELLTGGLSSGWKQLLGAGISDEEEYIETIKSVSKEHGVNFDKMAKDNETFEQTLTRGLKEGKIDADILTESVSKMATKMSKMSAEELKAAGYTKDHVAQIKALSKGLKDGSVSMDEFVDKMMKPSGRENLIESLRNAFDGLLSVIKPIKEAFKDVFPSMTGDQLYEITENIKKFTEGLTLSEEASGKIKRAFEGLFSVCELLGKGIAAVVESLFDLSQSEGIGKLADLILDSAASIGDFFTSLNNDFDTDGLSGVLSGISSLISDTIGGAVDGLKSFGDVLSKIGDAIVKVAQKIWDAVKSVFTWITDNVSAGDIFAGLAGGGIFVAAKKLSGLIDKIKGLFGGDGKDSKISSIKENFCDVLESVKGSLDAFTSGIKIGSLVLIAAAIGILSASIKTISEIDAEKVVKSLLAIAAMMKMLTTTLESMTKSLNAFESGGLIAAGIALILVAKAIDILADAMTEISKLSLEEIGKGLAGIGGGLLELCGALKLIDKVKIPLSTCVAILALAKSCEMLGDALHKFSEMSWDEIGRGLTAMGGALGELVAVMVILDKYTGGSSVFGSGALCVAVQSLEDMAAGLKDFAQMSWDEIGRGLSAMGGALGELGITLGALGKIAGFSSIFASGALVIVVEGLDEMASGLQEFGYMTWDEIGRGLSGMGGALGELGVVLGLLGKLAGFSSIFGSGAILIVVQGLSDLAESFKEFGSMTWDEIGRGLAGMGGALAEVGVVAGALGYLTNIAGILGAATIWTAVQGLDDLANAFKKFGEMTWEEIGRGLVGMGGALTELSVVSGALGYLTNIAGILGAATIWTAVQGLGDLADAFKKFGEMSWDEVKAGLAAMGGALGETALGGLLNTFSGIGAAAISEMAEPLGVLADSVKKWSDVTVPEDLSTQLDELADGVEKFTLAGAGASAIAEGAAGIGVLADSVAKWAGVTVPEGITKNLDSLADGVEKFTFAGMGAGALAESAPAVGILADSVAKWTNVTVADTLGTDLETLAKGVKAFTFGGMGASALAEAAPSLVTMADAVLKWANVVIPENLGTGLEALGAGVLAFTFGGSGASSLAEAAPGVGSMADAVFKWANVTVPEGLGANLETLGAGVKAFTFGGSGAGALTEAAPAIGTLADSVSKWTKVTIPEGLVGNLETLATGVKKFTFAGSGASSIATCAAELGTLADSVKKWSGVTVPTDLGSNLETLASSFGALSKVKFSGISSGLDGVADALNDISKISTSSIKESLDGLGELGESGISKLISAFENGGSKASKSAKALVEAASKAIKASLDDFKSQGEKMSTNISSGIKSKESSVKTAGTNAAKKAVSGAESQKSNMTSAGKDLGNGLVAGIEAKYTAAYNAGYALGQQAVQGEKDGQASASPSKLTIKAGKWLGEGLVIGMEKMASRVYDAGYNLGDTASGTISSAIASIVDMIDNDIDAQPTIRPVLDLSDVESGAGTINSILGMQTSVGLLSNVRSINTMMNRRNQNGSNEEVVSAINDLKKAIGDAPRNTYTLGDITYSEGDAVSEAIKELVHAVAVERRT